MMGGRSSGTNQSSVRAVPSLEDGHPKPDASAHIEKGPGDLHLGEHIAHYCSVVVLCYIEQLWPRQDVVEVVLQSKESD